uniref:Ribosomal protein L16 n=1 Tax=Babesia gibsoni TaxID=33632 RepID=A0A6M8NXW7_BABGI|nr:ribosomal protein L16 [Babesia gibsoni]
MINLKIIKNKKHYYNTHNIKLKSIHRNNILHYGDWGIITINKGTITPNQLEAMRFILAKNIKYIGKLWIKILPNHPITKRPKDSRMGAGKGKIDKWVFVLRPGDIIFEATKISKNILLPMFKLIKSKTILNIKIIYKNDIYSN